MVSKDIDALDYASGSLGHGLSVATGYAIANRLNNIYVILGDGELQEGSNWEAFLFIGHHQLKNLTVIIDKNSMQIDDWTKNIINTSSDIGKKLETFGFDVIECDGHSVDDLQNTFNIKVQKPKCIIANTVKGRELEFLHNNKKFNHFHASPLTNDEYEVALRSIV